MEQKTYERSINKLATSMRILDMCAIDPTFEEDDLKEMYDVLQLERNEDALEFLIQSELKGYSAIRPSFNSIESHLHLSVQRISSS